MLTPENIFICAVRIGPSHIFPTIERLLDQRSSSDSVMPLAYIHNRQS